SSSWSSRSESRCTFRRLRLSLVIEVPTGTDGRKGATVIVHVNPRWPTAVTGVSQDRSYFWTVGPLATAIATIPLALWSCARASSWLAQESEWVSPDLWH